jgi:thioredoxin 1
MLSPLDIPGKRLYCEISNNVSFSGGIMNNKLIIGVVIVLTLVGGIVALKSKQSSEEYGRMPSPTSAMEKTDTMMEKTESNDDAMKKEDGTMMQNETRYLAYSETAFDAAADKKRVLFFHAPWCPTCRPADAAFQSNSANIPEDVVLFKTDYDSSSALKKKYGITYQHTFVQVDKDGREVTKWNGGDLNDLIANIK